MHQVRAIWPAAGGMMPRGEVGQRGTFFAGEETRLIGSDGRVAGYYESERQRGF